jgi:hypothetical protein
VSGSHTSLSTLWTSLSSIFEREVNLNADKKKFWPGKIKSIDSKEMNESIPISLTYECPDDPSYRYGSIQFKGCKILFIVDYQKKSKRGEWDLNPRVLTDMGLAIPRPTRLGDPRTDVLKFKLLINLG